MNPRNLRHRLEKTAKLLVSVQKHLPEVEVRFDDAKGDAGYLLINIGLGLSLDTKVRKLGQELEGRGYSFSRSHNRWLGNITYHGTKKEQPGVVIEVATQAERLDHQGLSANDAFSFRQD